jgi:predicted permease
MPTLLQDVRYAARMLMQRPGFAAVVILTLALGITVNGAVFFFVSSFLLRPLPAHEPDWLAVIAQKVPQSEMPFPFSYPDLAEFRRAVAGGAELAGTFTDVMAYKEEPVHLSRPGAGAERTWIHAVSDNYFTVLGVQPSRGRFFLPGEGRRPGADPILVLTDEAWRSRFAADPQVVGRQVKLNGVPFAVVGVAAPGFLGAAWGTALSGFVPATMLPQLSPSHGHMIFQHGNTGFFLMGRLRSGASLRQGQAAVDVVMAGLVREFPDSFVPQVKAVVIPERRSRPQPGVASYVPRILSVLMAMALLVLAVAAANVTNLLFARAAEWERGLAIRSAMGASRRRLLWQVLVESLLLGLGAAVVGSLVTLGIAPSLGALGPGETMAPPAYVGTDWRLFVFTVSLSLATGLAAGLLPALKATRVALLPLLKEGSRSVAPARHPLRSVLAAAQIAVACAVLVAAGVGLRGLQALSRAPLGFQPKGLLLASFDLGLQRYDEGRSRQFQRELLERVRTLPGVRSAGLADQVPFDTGGSMRNGLAAEGEPITEAAKSRFVPWLTVDEGFLRTLGTPVVAGREFSHQDDAASRRAVIVNAALARQLWGDEPAVGKRLLCFGGAFDVVGVIGEGRFWAITDHDRGLVFQPLAQNNRGGLTLVARTEGDPLRLTSALRQIVRELDSDMPLFNVRTMEQQLARSPFALMPLRVGSAIAAVQGLIALLLAGLGIFGLISFAVARRTREIGVRIALGASTASVMRLVARNTLGLAGAGLGCGMVMALGVGPLVTRVIGEPRPLDASVLAAVAAIVLVVTCVAAWLPARRATRVEPVDVLRCE